MAWCRALGTSCPSGKSRSGTPRGERPRKGRPAPARRGCLRRVSRRSASPLVCGLGWAQENPGNRASREAASNMVGQRTRARTKNRAARTGALACTSPRVRPAYARCASYGAVLVAPKRGARRRRRGRPREARRVRGPIRDSERFQSSASVTDDDRHSGSSNVPSSRPSPRTAGRRSGASVRPCVCG
jgi:hypothetical protein